MLTVDAALHLSLHHILKADLPQDDKVCADLISADLTSVRRTSVRQAIKGELMTQGILVQAIPRVTSQGCVCGAVYRVASERNFNPGVRVLHACMYLSVCMTVGRT